MYDAHLRFCDNARFAVSPTAGRRALLHPPQPIACFGYESTLISHQSTQHTNRLVGPERTSEQAAAMQALYPFYSRSGPFSFFQVLWPVCVYSPKPVRSRTSPGLRAAQSSRPRYFPALPFLPFAPSATQPSFSSPGTMLIMGHSHHCSKGLTAAVFSRSLPLCQRPCHRPVHSGSAGGIAYPLTSRGIRLRWGSVRPGRSPCLLHPVPRQQETGLRGSAHGDTADGSYAPNLPSSARDRNAIPDTAPDAHKRRATDADPPPAPRTAAVRSARRPRPYGERLARRSLRLPDRSPRGCDARRKMRLTR
jgi:hypothetical protein